MQGQEITTGNQRAFCLNVLLFFWVDKWLFNDYTTSSLLQALAGLNAFNNNNAAGTCCSLLSPNVPSAVQLTGIQHEKKCYAGKKTWQNAR